MSKSRAVILAAIALAGCSTDSTVQTEPTWTQPTAEQDAAFRSQLTNPYLAELPAPRMENGCSTSITQERGGVVIPAYHPDETYCIRLAPLANTTIKLPPGAALLSATSAMLQFISLSSAQMNQRDVLMLTATCVPPRKNDAGAVQPAAIHEFVSQGSLPYCPRYSADLTVVMTTGIAQFKLILNESTHDQMVSLGNEVERVMPVRIPARPASAQDLIIQALDERTVPWWPDEAWADGGQTVIVWRRPMPTLPAMMLGKTGTQRASPRTVNTGTAMALVYPQRVTEFQLRIDDRVLLFTGTAKRPFIQPAGD